VSAAQRQARLLGQALVYEFRKVSEFRTGFVVRELLRGAVHPVVMIFVYLAIFRSGDVQTIGGFAYPDLVHYLILVATVGKLVFHMRGLDLADQIFEGYVTKFLVMPFSYFTLALGRWVQYVAVQLVLAAVVWSAGALLLPGWWPLPSDPLAAGQALVLILLGSYCFFLAYFIVNALAFWLDVVWTLLVMVGFVGAFVSGVLIPVSIMPQPLREAFFWLFPYWTLSAPIELYMGRLGTPDFLQGLGVLLGSAALLELLRRVVWTRGTRRYTGSGM
jgi:ABC-2 type transport system permease protein